MNSAAMPSVVLTPAVTRGGAWKGWPSRRGLSATARVLPIRGTLAQTVSYIEGFVYAACVFCDFLNGMYYCIINENYYLSMYKQNCILFDPEIAYDFNGEEALLFGSNFPLYDASFTTELAFAASDREDLVEEEEREEREAEQERTQTLLVLRTEGHGVPDGDR